MRVGERCVHGVQAIKTYLKNRLDLSDSEAVEVVSKLDLDGDGIGLSAPMVVGWKWSGNGLMMVVHAVRGLTDVSPRSVTLKQLEDLKTVLQQKEEMESGEVNNDGVSENSRDPMQT